MSAIRGVVYQHPRRAISARALVKLGLLRQTSMQRTFRLTFGRRAVSRPGAKLLKFGLKHLVDTQQGFYHANHIAATGGNNLIDNGVGTIKVAANHGASHGTPSDHEVPCYTLSKVAFGRCTLFTGRNRSNFLSRRTARGHALGSLAQRSPTGQKCDLRYNQPVINGMVKEIIKNKSLQ
jgi:hypothetical protein